MSPELAAEFPETNSQDFERYATSKQGEMVVFKCHVEYKIHGDAASRGYRRLEQLELVITSEVGNVIRTLFMFESWDDFDQQTFEQKIELLMTAALNRVFTVTEFSLSAKKKEKH